MGALRLRCWNEVVSGRLGVDGVGGARLESMTTGEVEWREVTFARMILSEGDECEWGGV